MFSLLFLLQFISANFAQLDTGNGSDGACTHATIVAGTRTYNCASLTIGALNNVFNGVGGAAVVIKVQGAVTITDTFSLNGANGVNANTTNSVRPGGSGGAGGASGGSSPGTLSDGENGNGAGGGIGGKLVNDLTNAFDTYGGGGGGGSYSTIGTTFPLNGDINSTPQTNTKGSQGSTYGSETDFEINFSGGSGGAAGGSGETTGGSNLTGSSGGGGGGALHIIAGGDITISGTIEAKGGNGGGDGASVMSGGGGGSGGAVWLQSLGNIIISGSISATGGTGGTNGSFGASGEGGSGGNGRIRLDDVDGVITGGGTVTPSAQVNSIAEVIARNNARNAQLTSDIDCAMRGAFSPDDYMSFVLGLFIVFGVKSFWRSQRSEKFLKEKRHSN